MKNNRTLLALALIAGLPAVSHAETQLSFSGTAKPLAAPVVTMPVYLPPKKFDHPHAGIVVTARVKSSDELKTVCVATWQPGYDVGCAMHLVGGCLVTVLEDKLLIARGFSPEQVMRHEIGHCNGWGADHAGAIDPRVK